MFRILVVDDEPTGLNHVCTIIEKKCPQYKIIGVAENGQQALDIIRKEHPDILITDIRMPLMDGIKLVSQTKKEFPEILSVIVSGYSDFEYAKGALQFGVCDYLLKPVVPSDMKKLLDQLGEKLKNIYYENRNRILSTLCNGGTVEEQEIEKYFPAENYYAALFRQNGLPRRFSLKHNIEIFSMEEEQIYIYGRDEMEALYLVPQSLLMTESFGKMADRIFYKEVQQRKGAYVTGVAFEECFELKQLFQAVTQLYRKLNEAIVIGKSRLIYGKRMEAEKKACEKKHMEAMEYYIHYRENSKLLPELKNLFRLWEKEGCSQMYVETEVMYLFRLLQKAYRPEKELSDLNFWIEDAFYYAADMKELGESVDLLIRQYILEFGQENIDNKEVLFHSILSYMKEHLEEAMSLGGICKRFGVSQTSLSRMFRTYKETSFSNYLTEIRIERAKQIMQKNKDAYVKDVAERCGYTDQFYFSRIFRSVTGMCPKEYIENVR